MSDKSHPRVRFARSATKHRVGKDRINHVITQAGLRFDTRLVYLGDGAAGRAVEIMAVEGAEAELIVIHAMPLREKFRTQYEGAMKWRR